MKRPEYKTDKWEKCAAILMKTIDYYYDQLSSLKMEKLNGDIDEVRYHLVLIHDFQGIFI